MHWRWEIVLGLEILRQVWWVRMKEMGRRRVSGLKMPGRGHLLVSEFYVCDVPIF
jgi:hypothetical protein